MHACACAMCRSMSFTRSRISHVVIVRALYLHWTIIADSSLSAKTAKIKSLEIQVLYGIPRVHLRIYTFNYTCTCTHHSPYTSLTLRIINVLIDNLNLKEITKGHTYQFGKDVHLNTKFVTHCMTLAIIFLRSFSPRDDSTTFWSVTHAIGETKPLTKYDPFAKEIFIQ